MCIYDIYIHIYIYIYGWVCVLCVAGTTCLIKRSTSPENYLTSVGLVKAKGRTHSGHDASGTGCIDNYMHTQANRQIGR